MDCRVLENQNCIAINLLHRSSDLRTRGQRSCWSYRGSYGYTADTVSNDPGDRVHMTSQGLRLFTDYSRICGGNCVLRLCLSGSWSSNGDDVGSANAAEHGDSRGCACCGDCSDRYVLVSLYLVKIDKHLGVRTNNCYRSSRSSACRSCRDIVRCIHICYSDCWCI